MPTLPSVKDPVLDGVNIQKSTVTNLTDHEVCALLINDAKPHYSLLQRALTSTNHRNFFALFEHGIISPETFETAILKDLSFEDIKCITLEKEHRLYEKFDFAKLRAEFVKFAMSEIWNDDYLKVALEFLSLIPYDEEEGLEHLNNIFKKIQNDPYYSDEKHLTEAQNAIINFMRRQIVGLDGSALLELLHSRPDYMMIIASNPLGIPKESFFYEEDENNKVTYATKMEEIYRAICRGEVDRIAFALTFFDELENFKAQILNSWVDADKVLELDIYANSMISDEMTERLDDEYIKAKRQIPPEKEKLNS